MMKPEWIIRGIKNPITMIGSDGMPYAPKAHPRTAGTFSRVLGKYVREEKAIPLMEALKTKISYSIIEHFVRNQTVFLFLIVVNILIFSGLILGMTLDLAYSKNVQKWIELFQKVPKIKE